jgi:hypothetical protein
MDKELDKCGDDIDLYISFMNDMKTKTAIARSLLSDIVGDDQTYHFLGSYLTFPKDKKIGEQLQQYYNGTNNGGLFDDVLKIMKNDLKRVNSGVRYICFLVGSIISKNDVNHHIGFIYDKDKRILRVMDSGIRSWDTNLANTIMTLVREVFTDENNDSLISVEVHTYSQKMSCFKKNPQDVTRGGYLTEFKVNYLSSDIIKNNRERFCQSWSLLLMLTDIERIKNGSLLMYDPYMEYWDKNLSSLEYCIRRFILWVVKKYGKAYFNNFVGYDSKFLTKLLKCFKGYIPNIEIPEDNGTICEEINIPLRLRLPSR